MGKKFLSTPVVLTGSWNHQPRVKMAPGEFSVGAKMPVCVPGYSPAPVAEVKNKLNNATNPPYAFMTTK